MTVDATHWHGWRIRDVYEEQQLYIGPLPGLDDIALYCAEERDGVNTARPLAYFETEQAAREAMAFIDRIAEKVTT